MKAKFDQKAVEDSGAPLFNKARRVVPLATIGLGLAIRLALAPYLSVPHDDAVWLHASLSGYYGLDLYARPGFSYPPVWGYVLQLIGALVHQLGQGPDFFGVRNPDLSQASVITGDFSDVVTAPVYNVMVKTVLFGIDLAIGILLLQLVLLKTSNVGRARLAFACWFLNPVVIYESAVHAAFDNLVGLSVLASVVFALYGRPFWSGMSWALGVLAKLTPVVVAPLILVALFTKIGNSSTDPSRSKLWNGFAQMSLFGVGSIVTAAVLLLPEALRGSTGAILTNTLARTHSSLAIGGLSIFGIRHLKPFGWLLDWGYQNSEIVTRVSEIGTIAAILLGVVWMVALRKRNPTFVLLTGTTGTLAFLMLVAPSSQPQYVLWFLPVLVAAVLIFNRGYSHLALLAVAPLTFSLAILGPFSLLAPLATYSHWISSTAVGTEVIQWYVSPGRLWGTYLNDDVFAPAVLITLVTLASLFTIWLGGAVKGATEVAPSGQ